MSETYKRSLSGRIIRREVTAKTAAEAIGAVTPNCEIFGLNKGQFSLIDILEHCLATTGPADVVLSTWTAAGADLGFAYGMMADGRIRSLRFIVDFSFPTRQPAYCAALRERFGDECIRITKTHAKFVLIRNASWNIVIRSSMNLNENRRLETFEISDHLGMAEFLEGVTNRLFESQETGKAFQNGAYQNTLDFEKFHEEGEVDASRAMESTDVKKFFGDGRYSNDLRRTGLARG